MQVIESRRKREHEIGAGKGVLCITTVNGVAGESRRIAKVLASKPAILTGSVGTAYPGDANTRASRQLGRSSVNDLADDLMTGNVLFADRRQFAFDNVQVGPANTTGTNTQQNVARL